MHATIDDNHLKDLMKIALMELLEEHPAMLRGLMAEAIEDMTAERSRSEREEEDEDELIRERGRRYNARTRRSRNNGSPPNAEAIPPRRSTKTTNSEFLTSDTDNLNATGWERNDEPPLPEDSITDEVAELEQMFKKTAPPSSNSLFNNTTANNTAFNNRTSSSKTTKNYSNANGPDYLLRGLTFLLDADLRPYIILPMLTSIFLFSFAVWLGMGQFGAFSSWTSGYLPFWLSWIDWLLWPIFTIAPVVIIFYFATLAANILAASFNSLLAEKVSRKLNALPLGGGPGFGTAILRVPSSLKEEWRKSLWFVIRAALVMVLFFVPLVNLAAPFIWALFSAWSLALKYLDYPVARQDLEFDETRALAAENRWLVLGFGAAVLLMTIIPIINFIAMPAAVAGASALWTERMAIRRNMSV